MTLAEVIRRARNRKGLTQEQLAEQLGVSRGYIGQLETGLVRARAMRCWQSWPRRWT